MPLASNIQILYNGVTDITNHVVADPASFVAQMNAQPGMFELQVRDPDLEFDFITGKTLDLLVDGVPQYGGFLFGVTRGFFFPAVDTTDLAQVVRKWSLRGLDYNVLFDKRVLRNPADYLHQLPNFTGGTMDGVLIREALTASKYYDVPAGFDVTSEVDDVAPPFIDVANPGAWPQQGSPMRELFESFSRLTGAVFYIDAAKRFHNKAIEDLESRWGFSDRPNRDVVTASPAEFQGATYGFREGDFTSDGSRITNDAMIWGGSEFSGDGATVFAREVNATSVTDHGLWQLGEARFGEKQFMIQSQVDERADVIVNGGAITELPGGEAFNPGQRFPSWQITLSWLSKDVPRIAGVPDHLVAGQLVTFVLYSFGADELNPLILTLPLRSLSMDFVALEEGGDAHVKFTGRFGLALDDPYLLWGYLLGNRSRIVQAVATTDGSSPAPYGAYFSGPPDEAPDGVRTVFSLPGDTGYIGSTSEVFKTGLLMQRGVDYSESDPSAGQITFTSAPSPADWIWITCRTL